MGGRWASRSVKVMLSRRRTIGKDRGGTDDKKHNKKHHLFVRMPCRSAPLKCIGFSHVSFLASRGKAGGRGGQNRASGVLLWC